MAFAQRTFFSSFWRWVRVKLLLKITSIFEHFNFTNFTVLIYSSLRSGLPRKLYATTGESTRFRAGAQRHRFMIWRQIETGRKDRVRMRVLSVCARFLDGCISFARTVEFSQSKKQPHTFVWFTSTRLNPFPCLLSQHGFSLIYD